MVRDSSGVPPTSMDSGKLHQGWLDTGDLGSVDEKRLIRLVGRVKDLAHPGRSQYRPCRHRRRATSHPSVTGQVPLVDPDRHAGEVPVAYVALSRDTDPSGSARTTCRLCQVSARRIGCRTQATYSSRSTPSRSPMWKAEQSCRCQADAARAGGHQCSRCRHRPASKTSVYSTVDGASE